MEPRPILATAGNDSGGIMAVLLAGQVEDGLGRVIPAHQSKCLASSLPSYLTYLVRNRCFARAGRVP